MMRRYRRYWVLLAGMMILAPLLVTVFAPPTEVVREGEWRPIAPPPVIPKNWADWQTLPGVIDAYAQDHFGLRTQMIRAQSIITHKWLDSDGKFAAVGHAGWLFLKSDAMIQQSAGLLIRDTQVDETADFLAALQHALAVQGTRFLVAMPPNSASVYGDMLPKWARNIGRPTEYDRMIADLKARGVPVVDLRPALKASRAAGDAYLQHDTHWSARGALAGYNATVDAAGHPDWRLDAAAALGPPAPRNGGDLARMLGLTNDVTEDTEPLTFTVQRYGRSAENRHPRRLVHRLTLYAPGSCEWRCFMRHASSAMRFRPDLVERIHPTEVWWMPTERFMPVMQGTRPIGWAPAGTPSG